MENLQVTFTPGKTVRIDGNAPRPQFAAVGGAPASPAPQPASNGVQPSTASPQRQSR